MDYKELLKKYMEHVCTMEGTYFLPNNKWTCEFSEEESKELETLVLK